MSGIEGPEPDLSTLELYPIQQLLPLVVGQIPNEQIDAIAQALQLIWDLDTLLVISSDFMCPTLALFIPYR